MFKNFSLYFFNILLAVLFLGTAIVSIPYLTSAFLFYRGSDALEKALHNQGSPIDVSDVTPWEPEQPAPGTSSAQYLTRAIGDLEDTVRWDARNERAYRYLVAARYLNRDFESAIGPLNQLINIRPGDRSLLVELGDVLSLAGQNGQAMQAWGQAGIAIADPFTSPVASKVRIPAEEWSWDPNNKIHKLTSAGETYVGFFANSCARQALLFYESGSYTLSLRVYNSEPGPAQMKAVVDGQTVTTIEFNSLNWTEISAKEKFGIDARAHRLEICFTNDYQGPLGDRNVYLDWIDLRRDL